VHLRLADVVFELPDDWRDTTTHQFLTADGSGSLIVEPDHKSADAAQVFTAALAEYSGLWGAMIIFTNRVLLRRGNGQDAPAAEGEQLAMDQVNRLRFALLSLTTAEWLATLRFLIPSSRGFMPLVQRIVSSAHFIGEDWLLPARGADVRSVQAGPLSLQIPIDWRGPDTFEFQHPSADEVTLSVTVAEPMVLPDTIEWDAVISEPFRILRTVAAPAAPGGGNDWETEWQLELPSQPVPWVVRKAVTQVTASGVVTALLRGPEPLIEQSLPAWSSFRRSLRPGSGR
jgi:hypothetical protein